MRRELGLSAKPDTSCFGACSSLTGPGLYQLVLELRQSAQDREHETAVRRGRIGPGVIQRSETSAALDNRCQHVQQVAGGSGEPIEPGDDKHVAFAQHVDSVGKLSAIRPDAAYLLGEDLGAAGRLQSGDLGVQRLPISRYARVSK